MPQRGPLRLPAPLVQNWRDTLIQLARLPRGTGPKTQSPAALMNAIMRHEAAEVGRLWSIFTQDRDQLTRRLLADKRSTVAYLLGFHLANAARTQMILSRTAERHELVRYLRASKGPIEWHDLGCGTGAVAHTVAHFILKCGVPQDRLMVHLSDLSGSLLDAASALLGHMGLAQQTRTHKFPLETLSLARLEPPQESPMVGYSLGYVWNELAKNPTAQRRMMDLFAARIQGEDRALILFLEPGTQEAAREAMGLRNRLVEMGYHPLYPCTHNQACPLLARSRDWCFSETEWERPKDLERLDTTLGLDRGKLSGSAYLLASPALFQALPQAKTKVRALVVGRPERTTKRGFDYLLCHAEGLTKVPHDPEKSIVWRGLPMGIPREPHSSTQNATSRGTKARPE